MQETLTDRWKKWWGKGACSSLQVHYVELNQSSLANIIRVINPTEKNILENIRKFGIEGRRNIGDTSQSIRNTLQMLRELKGRDYRVVFASLEYYECKDYFRIVLKKESQSLLSKSIKRNIRFNSIIKKKRNDFQSI